MFVNEWSEQLSSHAKQQFMMSPFWIEAAKRGLCWEKALMDKRSIKEAVDQMDEASITVLRTFYIGFGAGPVSEERLFSLREGLSGAEFRYGLIQLQNAGIVFALRQGWGERLYAMPSNCIMLWHPALFPIDKPAPANAGYGLWEQRQEDAAGKPLGRQLLAGWAELARTGLGLTAKGILPKKTTAKLLQAITLTGEDLALAGWQQEPQDAYPSAVSFFLKLSLQLGVLSQEENQLSWKEGRLAEWFAEPELMQEALLLQWCLEELLEKKTDMWHVMALLARLDPGSWYSEAVIAKQAHQRSVRGADWEPSWNSCLNLLHVFGWVEFARAGEGRMLRWTMMPLFVHQEQHSAVRPEPIMMEPNGDLLVPPGCPYLIRWELELIADRKNDDQLSVWQLTRSSIERALARGRTIPSIATFLQAASGGSPISPLLQASLTDWGKLEDGDTRRLTDDYPVLPFEHQSIAREFCLRSSGRTMAGREIMNHEDFRIERFLPELERVPINWMQQLRSYHPSTRLEIMERALSWQAPVQLSMDDAVVAFVPARLERRDGGWTVTGLLREAMTHREVCLTPEMWQGMKLVAPGVSGFA